MNFTDKVILVIGASSGIGADAARQLAKLGGKVAIVARDNDRLDNVIEQIKNDGSSTPLKIVADATKDAERIIEETIKHFGKLNVLVNSVGVIIPQGIAKFNIEAFDTMMNTNVRSVMKLVEKAVPHLEKTKGNIVIVSGLGGMTVIPGCSGYCVSRSALDMFTKCAALELSPKGIRVNSINPATINTPLFTKLGFTDVQLDGLYNKCKTQYPVRRVGEVSDTSSAIAYLASDSASFITGTLLAVDGGALLAGLY